MFNPVFYLLHTVDAVVAVSVVPKNRPQFLVTPPVEDGFIRPVSVVALAYVVVVEATPKGI